MSSEQRPNSLAHGSLLRTYAIQSLLIHHRGHGGAQRTGWSAIFAIEKIAHGFAAGCIRAFVGFQWVGGVLGTARFFVAALGTAVGESGLAGFEFKFFTARYASFDRVGHK
jgi:hypothetical protein